jgi:hypothetical protein
MAIGLYGPEYLQYADGGPARRVAIFVFLPGTKIKAVLYADKTGQYTGPNPTFTDQRGELVFFADTGTYDLYYSAGAIELTLPIEISTEDTVDTNEHVHLQTSPSDVWTIEHNLGSRPSVIAEDSTGIPDDVIYPAIRHLSPNLLELRWGYATSGRATLRR